MTGPPAEGRCILVGASPAEAALGAHLSRVSQLSPDEVAGALSAPANQVDLVVVCSQVSSPVAVAQQVHRLVPDAALALLTADVAGLRRQAMFAPAVPLDLLIAAPDEPDLLDRLRAMRANSVERRHNVGALAAAAHSAAVATVPAGPGPTAVGPLLEHAPIAVLLASPQGALLGWNREAEALLKLAREHRGRLVDDILPGASALISPALFSPGLAEARPHVHPPLARLAPGIDIELSAARTQTDTGAPAVLLLAVDVTARRDAERARDRLAEQVQLLGRISESLIQSLEPSESLSRLAAVLVPALADWASIQVREDDDHVYDVVVRHRDPGLRHAARALELMKTRRGVLTGPSRRAAGGENVLLPRVAPEELAEHVPDPELRALVRQLGMGSALAVPIPGRAGLHGSMLLVNLPGGDSFADTDLALATEIGRRAGMALDNARLYAGQRYVATELQRSLLTAPPAIPFADIAVRYVAAARQAQVGGDWYDAFRRQNGDLILAIGDVVGHDTRAAAAMGQLRGLLRGIAFATVDEPERVLSGVDEAIEGLELATMATAVLAQLSPPHDGGIQLRWSNAGHPSPVLLDPQGKARLLNPGTGKADLLLGIDPATPRTSQAALLPAGSTLLLYTDGLVERRGQSLDDGLAKLLASVEDNATEDLDRLCDAIVEQLAPQAGEDDIAIVAVRAHAPARDATLWRRQPPPDPGPGAPVLGRWEPTTPRQLTADRMAFVAALRAAPPPVRADEEAIERLETAFEELVSNALRHGRAPVRAVVTGMENSWLLEVSDAAVERPPTPAIDRDAALGGLGLHIVARLSQACGWATDGERKTVWARVARLPGGSPAAPAPPCAQPGS